MALPEHLRLFLTSPLPTSVWVGDELIVHTNDAFAKLVGDKLHAAVVGRPASEGFGELWPMLEPLVARAPTVADNVRLVLERDGVRQEVFATVAMSRSSDGLVCTFIDTTEHVRTRQRLAATDELIGVIGHELRAPLAPIVTTLDVMRMSGDDKHVDDLERPVRQISRLLDGLLEYSRISRGMLSLHRERVELARVFSRALELAGPFAAHTEVTAPPAGLAVLADGERIASAISHLLVHGEHPGLDVVAAGDRVRIVVRDEAWKPEHLAQHGPHGGLGLALEIARSLVELHGGRFETEAKSVAIELPAEVAAHAPPPDVVRTRNRKRVLLVEDNDDTARSLRTALEMIGYDVAVAHDGPVALTVARAFHPDVALLDIGLPVMDGYELANRLRALQVATGELHVVAVTAYGTDEFKQRSQDAGFAEHLVKPVDLARLERVVESLG